MVHLVDKLCLLLLLYLLIKSLVLHCAHAQMIVSLSICFASPRATLKGGFGLAFYYGLERERLEGHSYVEDHQYVYSTLEGPFLFERRPSSIKNHQQITNNSWVAFRISSALCVVKCISETKL